MPTIHHQFDARCSTEALWRVLADLTLVQKYNPTISAARIRGARTTGAGAERECDLKPKGRIVERVFRWDDGKALGVEVIESDWPMRTIRWVTRITPQGSGSRVTQQLDYTMKFGILGAMLDMLAARRNLTRNVGATLEAFIAYAEARK